MLLEVCKERFLFLSNSEEILKEIDNKNVLLLALNAGKLSISGGNFWSLLNHSFNVVGYPDGIGANLRLFRLGRRVPGVELWLKVLDTSKHKKVFLLGGNPDVFNRSIDVLNRRYPMKSISGMHGYSQYDDILKAISLCEPTLIIAALGSPKQEMLLVDLKRDLSIEFSAMGIGGSLDVLVGHVKRAPLTMQILGMEGIWRILLEPKKRLRNIKSILLMWKTPIYIIK